MKMSILKKLTINNISSAFSLAELLLVLVIVSIIASETLPQIIMDTQDMQFSVAVKKNYGTFIRILDNYRIENASDISSLFPAGESSSYALDLLAPYLNISKRCDTGTGCWAKETKSYKPNNDGYGNYSYGYDHYDDSTTNAKALLADGTSIAICSAAVCKSSAQTCHYEYDSFKKDASGNFILDGDGNKIPVHVTSEICAFLVIDVNGPKAPNQYGVDTFLFDVYNFGDVRGGNKYLREGSYSSPNISNILSGNRLVRYSP
jgi:prepilin-type N-terminal cleavage/methylation domain-containing protein